MIKKKHKKTKIGCNKQPEGGNIKDTLPSKEQQSN